MEKTMRLIVCEVCEHAPPHYAFDALAPGGVTLVTLPTLYPWVAENARLAYNVPEDCLRTDRGTARLYGGGRMMTALLRTLLPLALALVLCFAAGPGALVQAASVSGVAITGVQ